MLENHHWVFENDDLTSLGDPTGFGQQRQGLGLKQWVVSGDHAFAWLEMEGVKLHQASCSQHFDKFIVLKKNINL